MDILKIALLRSILVILIQSNNRAFGRILRRACGDYADFSYSAYKQVLLGHVIRKVIVSSRAECEKKCVNEYTCKSVNVQMYGVERPCELNSRSFTDKSDGVSLTSKNGWVFSSTSYHEKLVGHVCKRLNPCLQSHICIDVCYKPGYKCIHCKQLTSGSTCVREIYNIALSKPAFQSSVYGKSKTIYRALYAVDGILETVMAHCIHTKCLEKNPWWGVDFEGHAVVFAFELLTRTDERISKERAAGLEVRIGNEKRPHAHSNIKVWVTIAEQTQRKEFDVPQKGRYLYLVSRKDTCLDFCEVKVEGYLE